MSSSNVLYITFIYLCVGFNSIDSNRHEKRAMRTAIKGQRNPSYEGENIDVSWISIGLSRLNKEKCRLDKRFLSFTIDIIEMKRNFQCAPLEDERFNKLALGLAPAYLRVGGTPQDFLTFNYDLTETPVLKKLTYINCTPHFENWKHIKKFNLPITLFDKIAEFSERNNLDLIFGLNARVHNKGNQWDIERIVNIIKRATKMNYPNIAWEIGNEPNRYSKYGKNQALPARKLASYFKMINEYIPKERLFGPDISHPKYKTLKYLSEFLKHRPPIKAVTYHHYFMHESESTVAKYLNPAYLDILKEQMLWIKSVIADTNTTQDLWLGEAGSSSGGGKNGLSDSYIAGFLYIGKIGLSALTCHKVMIRQSFYGGFYGMLDSITHNPLPDYWISYIYKQLVSEIYLTEYSSINNEFKIHAYCNKRNRNDVTLMFVNFQQEAIHFLLDEFELYNVEVYILQPSNNNLLSKSILLNDKVLEFDLAGNLPIITGKRVEQPIGIPGLTYGFMVVKDIVVSACQNNII